MRVCRHATAYHALLRAACPFLPAAVCSLISLYAQPRSVLLLFGGSTQASASASAGPVPTAAFDLHTAQWSHLPPLQCRRLAPAVCCLPLPHQHHHSTEHAVIAIGGVQQETEEDEEGSAELWHMLVGGERGAVVIGGPALKGGGTALVVGTCAVMGFA
jgi:hypothetical protein